MIALVVIAVEAVAAIVDAVVLVVVGQPPAVLVSMLVLVPERALELAGWPLQPLWLLPLAVCA